jgi:uncharacterized protein (TIRG00374 family)
VVKAARVVIGIAISAAFAWATLSRVDLPAAGQAMSRAALPGVAVAFVFAWLEIGVRAWRWRFLLSSLGKVSYERAFAYTCVGYFANTLLPMRLGEFARAYLAASAMRLSRLATLGSIVTERVTDGLTIVAIAASLGLVVSGASVPGPQIFLAIGCVVLIAAVGILVPKCRELLSSLIPARVRGVTDSLIRGADAAKTPSSAATIIGSTLVAYACSVGAMLAVAGAVGLHLTVIQAAFAMSWIALSTAIPAAPGSVGTYEFVGVGVLTLLGQDPASSLAVVVLLHLLGSAPVAIVGLIITWALHVRVWTLENGSVRAPEPAVQAAA